jgi:hypothetical protein
MAVALRGNLQDFGIAEVFQLIGQQRKTGTLDVCKGSESLRLAFDAGCIVWARPVGQTEDAVVGERLVRCGLMTQDRLEVLQRESETSARPIAGLAVDAGEVSAEDAAEIESLVTNETIFIVLRWSDGSFDFTAKPVHHDLPAEKLLHAEQILMDGLRMVDEWRTFAKLVPNGDIVFERKGPLLDYQRRVTGETKRRFPSVERVFALVDGRMTAQRIIDLSRLGLFDATRALAELHHHDVIVPLSKRQARARRRKSDRPVRPVAEKARWGLAAAFPLALLAGLVSIVLDQQPPPVGSQVLPIVREPLADARQVFEKRRVRHVLEAQRLLVGAWPGGLDEVASTGLVEPGALTPSNGGAYYYARRKDGIVLLAPER